MFGEYAALAKWALIIGTISTVIYFIQDFGYDRAWNKYKLQDEKRMVAVNKVIAEEHDKFIQETTKSGAYADFINGEYNAKVEQIKQLKNDILDFKSDVSRMRQRAVCGRGENRMPTNNDSSVHSDTTADDGTGFSQEFKSFLESQARRDEYAVNWINSAIEATKKLCTQPNVRCEHD